MKKLFFILYLFHRFSNNAIAQKEEHCGVSGIVKNEDGKPLDLVVITLKKSLDSSIVKSMITGDSGNFSFTNLATGNYHLIANLSGYREYKTSSFFLHQGFKNVDLILISAALITEDIVVEGQKSFIRQEAGITIVDIEKNITNAGLSLTEALNRVPGVSVDNNGKLKLKGKEGVMVMIDDKPFYMDATQLGALLKSIPADQVKQIEVMTSPSAKYDAAGNAGIVNIRLKKGAYEGFDGSINNSIGRSIYTKGSSGINVSYRKNKLTLNGGYQYNYKKNYERSFVLRNYSTSQSQDSAYNTNTTSAQIEHINNFLLGGNVSIGKNGNLNWDANTTLFRARWNGGTNSQIISSEGTEVAFFNTVDRSRGLMNVSGGNVGYKQKFDTTGTELSMLVDYKSMSNHGYQNLVTTYSDQAKPATFYNSSIPAMVLQRSVKVDFAKTMFSLIKGEIGIKYNNVLTENKVENTLNATNHFIYTENIFAAYAQLGIGIKKWNIQTGLRMEHTNTQGDQKSIDSVFTRNYANLFPTASIAYKLSDKSTYTFLYAKRIERPNYHSLNPYSYYSDPFNVYSGNPYLLTQYTQHLELTASLLEGILIATVDYSYTGKPRAEVFIFDKTSLVTNYTIRNLTSRSNTGISFSLNKPVTKWWSMTNYLHGFYNSQTGNIGFGENTFSRYSWTFNTTHSFKLPKKFAAELSGVYESSSLYGTIFYKNRWQISSGISKKIIKDKFTLKLSATDLFWKFYYVGEGTFGNIKTKDGYKWDNRVIMFTLIYHLRKSLFSNEKEKPILEEGGKGR